MRVRSTRGPRRPPDAGDSNMQKDLTAHHGPRPVNAALSSRGRSRRRTVRGLLALPLALVLIAPATALAAEPTTPYGGQTTPPPTTTTVPTTTTPAPTTTTTTTTP